MVAPRITVPEDELLRVEYIPLDLALLWDDNRKVHSLPQLTASIERYGFKDPPKFEPTLNKGRGGIVEGNGRFEALAEMRRKSLPAPRGVANIDGQWLVPVLFGVDAASEAAAEAYGVDHNNITLGGSVDVYTMISMWQDGFSEQLARLSEASALPVSVSPDDLLILQHLGNQEEANPPDLDDLAGEYGEPGERDFWPVISVKVAPDTMELWRSLLERTGVPDEALAVAILLAAVDTAALGG